MERLCPGGWHQLQIRDALSQWLKHNPREGGQLQLAAAGTTLKWSLEGTASSDEYLLRLVNEDQTDERDLLKQRFAVTSREAEVLLWVAKDKTNREIAQILELSPRTVNKHLEQLFKKIGVENRTTAATLAVSALQKSRI